MLLRCSVGGWGASGVCPTTSAAHCVLPFSCSTSPESWKNSFSIASMLAPPRLFINYSFHFSNFSAFHNFVLPFLFLLRLSYRTCSPHVLSTLNGCAFILFSYFSPMNHFTYLLFYPWMRMQSMRWLCRWVPFINMLIWWLEMLWLPWSRSVLSWPLIMNTI